MKNKEERRKTPKRKQIRSKIYQKDVIFPGNLMKIDKIFYLRGLFFPYNRPLSVSSVELYIILCGSGETSGKSICTQLIRMILIDIQEFMIIVMMILILNQGGRLDEIGYEDTKEKRRTRTQNRKSMLTVDMFDYTVYYLLSCFLVPLSCSWK